MAEKEIEMKSRVVEEMRIEIAAPKPKGKNHQHPFINVGPGGLGERPSKKQGDDEN